MNFKKPKNPGEILDFLDSLVARIPERIGEPIKKLAIVLFAIAGLYVVYVWAIKGYDTAPQLGQELAKDTKSLFLEDIEKAYNRKRTNIRMPEASTLLGDDLYKAKKEYEPSTRMRQEGESVLSNPNQELLERESEIRALKSKNQYQPPLSEQESSGGYLTRSEKTEESPKPKKNYAKDNFDNSSSDKSVDEFYFKTLHVPESRNKVLDKKKWEKPEMVNEDAKILKNEIPQKEKKEKLIVPSRNKQNSGDILPMGNE
jgi:hypothetical protein